MRLSRLIVSVLVAATPLLVADFSHAGVQLGGAAPRTIPALQQWAPGNGSGFTFGAAGRVVVDPAYAGKLDAEADTFSADATELLGRPVPVAHDAVRAGDVFLTLGGDDRPEGYSMTVDASLTVKSRTTTGVFYGTRTVLQLLRQGTTIQPGTAKDWPVKTERGLMVDQGRKFFSVDWLKKHVKELAYLKLNTFQFHLSDVYGYRLRSASHPEINTPERPYYTDAQVAELVALGNRYHVSIVPEIDMPGHMTGILDNDRHRSLGLPNDPKHLDLRQDGAYTLARDLLRETMALFPGKYVHIGADEYLDTYPDPQSFATTAATRYGVPGAKPKDIYYGFVNWANDIVRAEGRTMRMWGDGIRTGDGLITPNRNIIVEHWNNDGIAPQQLLDRGHLVANAAWTPTYYVVGFDHWKADNAWAYQNWTPERFENGATSDTAVALADGVTSEPAVVVGADGNTVALTRRSDNTLRLNWMDKTTGQWSGDLNLASGIAGNPALARNPDNNLGALYRSADGRLWYREMDHSNGQWSPATELAAGVAGDPIALGKTGHDTIVLARRTDGSLRIRTLDRATKQWRPEATIASGVLGDPAVVVGADGNTVALTRRSDNTLRLNWMDKTTGQWSGDLTIANGLAGDPALVVGNDGNLQGFYRGTDNTLRYLWMNRNNGVWSGAVSLSGSLAGEPVAIVGSDANTVVVARRSDGGVRLNWQDHSTGVFSGDFAILNNIAGDPAVVVGSDGNLQTLARGTGGVLRYRWMDKANGSWSTDANLGSLLHVWCDTPMAETEDQIALGIRVPLRWLAQQTWGSPKPVAVFVDFVTIVDQIGSVAGTQPDLAFDRPVTASGTEASQFPAGAAVDGSHKSRWSSTYRDDSWITVDLGSSVSVRRIVLRWEAAYGKAYRIEVSDNGATWATVTTVLDGDGGVDDLAVSGQGRYVRLYGITRSGIYGYSLHDFAVYQ